MNVNALFLFLTIPWVGGLRYMFVAFPGHIHLLFGDLELPVTFFGKIDMGE